MTNRSIRAIILRVLTLILTALAAAAGLLRLQRSVTADAQANSSQTPVSYVQVAPILQTQCAGCHNPQGGAPFSLLTYEDAKQWGGQILDVTQSRYMPPWLPAPGKGDFAGARRMSDTDLATLRAWVGAGMPGSPGSAPPSTSTAEWAEGKPDAVLTLPEPIALPGNGADVFTSLTAPAPADGVHELRAIAVKPSDPQAVRSVWINIDESGAPRRGDQEKQGSAGGIASGIAGMEPPALPEIGSAGLIFWTAGTQSLRPRAGEQWRVSPSSNLVLTTHLKTTGRKESLQLQIGLYYTQKDASVKAILPVVLRLAHRGAIDIAPGAATTEFHDSYTLPQAALVTAIYPRAHFLARSFDAYATTPAGKQIWLLSIPKWDVDWLEVYVYRRPVMLPRGSIVHWSVTYDNSAQNPHNPSDPPAAVHEGATAKDEVDTLLLELTPPPGVQGESWRRSLTAATH